LYCIRALLCLTETNELSASRLDAPRRAHHRQLRRTDPRAEVIPTGSFNHASAPDMVIRPCAPLSEATTEAMEPETDIKSQV
jgi:hypothetical protein